MTTFGTAASQHFTTVGGLHTLTETMYAFAAAVVRLECTFHDLFTFYVLMKCGPGERSRVPFFRRDLQATMPASYPRRDERTAKVGKLRKMRGKKSDQDDF
jgi:hypothetical protein